jgi:hypothetical protein
LDDIAEANSGNTVLKQAQLVNLPFVLDSLELATWTDKVTDAERSAYIATVTLFGEDAQKQYWLDGQVVRPQLEYIIKNYQLPLSLKLVTGAGDSGKAYKLQSLDTPVLKNQSTDDTHTDTANAAKPTLINDISPLVESRGGMATVLEHLDDKLSEHLIYDENGNITFTEGTSASVRTRIVAAIKALPES